MDHLFVYGTLLSDACDTLGAAMRARLQIEAILIGNASTPGRLYDLGGYPGMVEADRHNGSLVKGEVLQLHDAKTAFRWLDEYEGVDPVNSSAGLYVRAAQLAMLDDGREIRCWVYVMNGRPSEAALIAGGDWLSHGS